MAAMSPLHEQGGTSLIEVLVTVVIVALGLMGAAGLQSRYAAADLVVDQLNVGWYGLFSIEAMALGKPCIVRLDADAAARTEEAFGTRIPDRKSTRLNSSH